VQRVGVHKNKFLNNSFFYVVTFLLQTKNRRASWE
jgi:hypothetical protein